MQKRYLFQLGLISLGLLAIACHRAVGPGANAPETPQQSPGEDAASDPNRPTAHVARSGRVALRSFELAGRVAWEGITTCAGAVGGMFEDGLDGAEKRWREGSENTREVARTQADGVKRAARDQRRGSDRRSGARISDP